MYNIKSFNDVTALSDYLNGAILGNPLSKVTLGLHNLTLLINKATVIFADATNAGLSAAAILAQIRAADASMSGVVLRNYGYTNSANPQLAIIDPGYKLMGAGTANAALGLPAADTSVSEVNEEDIVDIAVNPTGPLYCVVTHE